MRVFVVIWLAVLLCITGCGKDYKEIADRRVENRMFAKYERREAIPFFEQKGRYFDMDESTTVDRDVVLPLLKRLNEVEATEQWVVIHPKIDDLAGALLVELPGNAETVEQMAKAVQE